MASATTLTSLTAYRKLDYRVLADTDITELDLAASDVHEIQHQWSEELTLSRVGQRLSWVGGLFLLADDDRQPTSIRLGGPQVVNRLAPRVEAATGAAFGQATLALTRRVSATAGLRYTHERKTIDNAGSLYAFDGPEIPLTGSSYSYQDAIEHDAWTPRVALQLQVAEQSLAYVSATRGFKSGGFNISSPEPGRGYAPEWAWSYEAGWKSTFADGRARLNLAAFHTDYEDLQVQTAIRPGILDISNAAAATIHGVELEGAWRPCARARLRRSPGLAGRSLRPVPGGGRGRGHGQRGRPPAEQRARVVGTPVARVDRPGRDARGRCRFARSRAGRAPSSSRRSTTRSSGRTRTASWT